MTTYHDATYYDRQACASWAMHEDENEFQDWLRRFDEAAYCLDAPERLPAGSTLRIPSLSTPGARHFPAAVSLFSPDTL